MSPIVRRACLGPLVLACAAPALAQPGGGEPCAPDGMRPPVLSLLDRAAGQDLLFLNADPALALGGAMLLVEDRHGPFLPPGQCVTGLRGRMSWHRSIDVRAHATWHLPPAASGDLPRLRVLAWPAGGSWDDVHVSNALVGAPGPGAGPGRRAGVVLTEIQKDPTTVGDSAGEWIEVHNPGPAAVDLEGWTLADLGSDLTVLDAGGQGIVVPPGGYLVLGREADPALNGGVPVDATYAGLTLSNGEDEVMLVRPDGTVADLVAYDDGVLWPDEAGRALALDPAALDADLNDDGARWCSATSVVGGGPDTGTPGAANDDCGG